MASASPRLGFPSHASYFFLGPILHLFFSFYFSLFRSHPIFFLLFSLLSFSFFLFFLFLFFLLFVFSSFHVAIYSFIFFPLFSLSRFVQPSDFRLHPSNRPTLFEGPPWTPQYHKVSWCARTFRVGHKIFPHDAERWLPLTSLSTHAEKRVSISCSIRRNSGLFKINRKTVYTLRFRQDEH